LLASNSGDSSSSGTTTDSGNQYSGAATYSDSGSNTTTNAQTSTFGSDSYETDDTDQQNYTDSATGNSLTGDDDSNSSLTDQDTATETDTPGGDGQTLTGQTTNNDQSTVTTSGNDLTGDYNTDDSGSSANSDTQETGDTSNPVIQTSSSSSYDVQSQGNNISGTTSTNSSASIDDPSFESPAVGAGQSQLDPTGSSWDFEGNAYIQSNGSTWAGATAPDGTQTAVLQGAGNAGSISQTITFAAGTYQISFEAAQCNGQVQPICFSVDGVTVGDDITPTGNSFASYTTTSFTVAAGSHTITFAAGDGVDDVSSFVDLVAFTAPGSGQQAAAAIATVTPDTGTASSPAAAPAAANLAAPAILATSAADDVTPANSPAPAAGSEYWTDGVKLPDTTVMAGADTDVAHSALSYGYIRTVSGTTVTYQLEFSIVSYTEMFLPPPLDRIVGPTTIQVFKDPQSFTFSIQAVSADLPSSNSHMESANYSQHDDVVKDALKELCNLHKDAITKQDLNNTIQQALGLIPFYTGVYDLCHGKPWQGVGWLALDSLVFLPLASKGLGALRVALLPTELGAAEVATTTPMTGYTWNQVFQARYGAAGVAWAAPQLAGEPLTLGVLRTAAGDFELESGWNGYSTLMAKGSPGFDIVTRTHVEGQAAALMEKQGIKEGLLYINNPAVCSSCARNLPYMLGAGRTLEIVLPDGTSVLMTGIGK
jgi:hypothetical protein